MTKYTAFMKDEDIVDNLSEMLGIDNVNKNVPKDIFELAKFLKDDNNERRDI